MKLYIDTSVLVKLYYPEADSDRLENWLIDNPVEIALTPLHNLELINAFSLKVHRNEITEEEYSRWQKDFNDDKSAGVLKPINLDYADILLEAAKIADSRSMKFGTRSLDVIHVASAIKMSCTSFLSNDRRQLSLADDANLRAMALEEL